MEEKREAREKASELEGQRGGGGGRGNEDEAREREKERKEREGDRKNYGVNRQFHVVGRT